MKYVHANGADIPALGLGTWQLRGADAQRITERALAAGYRHLDTAQMYGNEREIGKAIARASLDREALFLTTKVWWENLPGSKFSRSVEASLTHLGVDYVDLLLIHWPHPELPLEEYLEALVRVQEQGGARHIGISNFIPEQVERAVATGARLVTNQVEYHPLLDQSAVRQAGRRHGLSLTAYAPLAQGQALQIDVITRIARRHARTPAQVTLRWLVQQDDVIAIPKTSTPERLPENLDIFDFRLSNAEMDQISALTRRGKRLVNPAFAPEW